MDALEEGRALFLRCLLSPVRLLTAAMWHILQREAFQHYGTLEHFVSLITDTVPDLLSYRQKTQLTMGLRAKLVLELCGTETPADPDTVQGHLQRIKTLVALHKELESGDAHVEESGANFVALVQILMKDPAEKSVFFKDVYPLQYGEKFSTALQRLMWLFLSRLENALPQPTIEEAAHMLSTAPTVMEECLQSLSQPQHIKNILKYQQEANLKKKDTTQLCSTAPDDCILSCLGSPRLVQILHGEQTPLDTQSESVLDYIPSYSQEVQVESVVITQHAENELETCISEENDDSMQYTNECDPEDTKDSTEVASEETGSLDLHIEDTGLDGRSEKQGPVEVSVVDMEAAADGGEESRSHEESRMGTNRKEATDLRSMYTIKQSCVKLDRLDLSDRQFSTTFKPGPQKRGRGQPKKSPQKETMCSKKQEENKDPCASVNKPTELRNGVSSIVPKLKKTYTVVKGASGQFACSLCSFQDAEEIQLHHHLIVQHPEEYKRLCVAEEENTSQAVTIAPEKQNSPVSKVRSYRGVPVCKTCPICGKTFTRSSDMRRHQVSHTVDRPFVCKDCGKTFRYNFDLRRHQQRVCTSKDYVVVYHRRDEDASVGTEVDDSGAVCQELHSSDKFSEKTECSSSDLVISAESDIQPYSLMSIEKLAVSDVSKPTHGSGSLRVNSHSRRHLKSPSSDNPYKCFQCCEVFKYSYNLKTHQDVCKGKSRSIGSSQSILKKQVSDTSEPGTGVSAVPSLQVPLCLDEQELEENAVQSTKSVDLFLPCSQCETKCKDTCMLIKHKQICASNERSFKCVKCDAVFINLLDVQKHVQIHWGEDPLQCSQCGKYCQNQSDLARHTLAHEKDRKLPCTLCSETLERLHSLRQHYLYVHDFQGPYQCSKCEKTHTDLKAMVKHMKMHSEERPYKCSLCSKSFKQRNALTVHARIHSEDKPFLCEECGKCFSSNISLQRHYVSHKTERPFTCPQCKNCFKTRYALHSHLLKHTAEASIPCKICGKMFYRASTLHRHHRTHTGERPYSCPKCGKSFLSTGEVSKHMRYHTGERPFRCTLCSKTFTQTCYLRVHMRIHTGERPYTCSICKRAFVCNAHLKRHMLVHTQERPFKCDCGKAFNQAHPLKMHQRSQCLLQKQSL